LWDIFGTSTLKFIGHEGHLCGIYSQFRLPHFPLISLAYLLLGLTAFLGWKQSILDAPALLVIASIVIGWSVVEWLRNKDDKYTYLIEGLCVIIAVALVMHVLPGS
jgi:hypothetical protein